MARRKSSRGRVFYYPSSLPKMQDGGSIPGNETEDNGKVEIRVDVANESTTWNPKLTDIINNHANYSQAEVIDAVQKIAALFPKDTDKIITTPGVSSSEAGKRYVDIDPATGLPKLKKGGDIRDIQRQGYKDNSPYKNRRSIDIYSNNITMDGVSQPLLVRTDTGQERILEPNSGNHYFPGANVVTEIPLKDTPSYFSGAKTNLTKYQTGGQLPMYQTGGFLPMYEDGGDITEDPTEEDDGNTSIDQYIETLMQQENAAMKGYDANKGLWFPHKAPEEGGGMDIGYGHKIKSNEDFSGGLTDEEVRSLLASDLSEKMDSAARKFNGNNYTRTWDDLRTEEQILLTDYEYNVGLTKFPKLVKAVAEQDIETMLNQYKRYSDGKPLTSRNNWTKGFIENKIKKVSANPEKETIETLKTTPIDNKIAPNVILNSFPQSQTQDLKTKSSGTISNPGYTEPTYGKYWGRNWKSKSGQMAPSDGGYYYMSPNDEVLTPDEYKMMTKPLRKNMEFFKDGGSLPKAQFGQNISKLYNKTKDAISEDLDYVERIANTLPQYLNPKTYSYTKEEGLDSIPNYNKYNSFGEAFKQAREDLGRGQTFLYNGKRHTTTKENEFPSDESERVFNTMTKTFSPEQKNKAKEYYFKQGAPYLSLEADDAKFNILPNAQVSFSDLSNRSHVNPVGPYNKVYLKTMDYDLTPDEISEYEKSTGKTFYGHDPSLLVEELAHIEQVRDKGTGPFFKHFLSDAVVGKLQKKSPYDTKGAIEYDAHEVIGPKRLKEIMGYQDGGQLPKAQEGRQIMPTYLPDKGGYRVPVDLESGNIKGGILPEVTVSGEATPLVRLKKAYETNNPFDAQQYATDLFNNPKSREEYFDRFNKDKFFQKYGQRGYNEFQDNAWKFAAEQRMSQLPQGNRSRIEYLNDLTAKEEEVFKKYNPALQTTYSTDFLRAINAKDREGYEELKDKLYNGPEKDLYTEREKQNMLQNYEYIGGVHGGDALAPLTWMSKPIQSIYRDDYSGYDALVGRKNDASLKEDLITDPTLLYGLGKSAFNLGVKGLTAGLNNYSKSFALIDDVGAQAFKPLKPKQLPGSGNVNDVGKLNFSNKLDETKDQLSKAIKGTTSTLNEIKGELLQGKVNRESIKKGNEWLENWIKHPATKEKIDTDIDAKIDFAKQYLNNSVEETDLLNLIRTQSKNFKPNSKEYSLLKQLDDNLQQYLSKKSRNPIHQGNWGVSYHHTTSPQYRKAVEEGLEAPFEKDGSWISRTTKLPQDKRISTTIHEGTHDWVSEKAFKKSGMRNTAIKNMNPKIKDDFLEWERHINSGVDPVEKMGKERAYQAYLADPTEQHARIMELRYNLKIPPTYKMDLEYAEKVLKWIDKGGSKIDPKFLNVIDKDPKKLAELFNKFWMAPAPLVGAGVVGSQYFSNPQEQVEYRNGGSLPKAEIMIDPATGLPKLKKGGKAWIQGAIKKPGALKATAKRAGATKSDGTIKKTWLREKARGSGKTAQRARLAITLGKMKK